jgi:glycerophosphoryl diester phosphodiesterase
MNKKSNTLLVFHRGGGRSLGYPPNCMATIKWALSFGALGLEYDVCFCQDKGLGKVAVIEPKLLKENNLDINDLYWDSLKKINAGNAKTGFCPVVELEDILQLVDNSKVAQQIHIKGERLEIIKILLLKLRRVKNFVLTSFDLEIIKEIRKENKNVRSGWIVKSKQEKGSEGTVDLTAQIALNPDALPAYSRKEIDDIVTLAGKNLVNIIILCGPRIKDKKLVDYIKSEGFEVGAWGVASNLEIAKRLISFNLDRFTIDNPEQLLG